MLTDPTQLPEAYAAAVYAKDVAAFAALYAPDVRIFDAWGGWQQRGLDALHASTAEWFGSLGEERVVVTVSDVQSSAGDKVAAIHGLIEFRAISASGEKLRAMQERVTWLLEKQGGGWRVTHQHSSLPADFETGKVMK